MTTYNKKKSMFWFALGLVLLPAIATFGVFTATNSTMAHDVEMYSTQYNKEVGTEVEEGVLKLIADGRYKCCLENSCIYCFADIEHQDRALVCDCLVDIMNGEGPCGECVGEIMEGEGNPLIAEYFATSIAQEVGVKYLNMLQEIMEEKYGIPVSKQL